MRYSAPEPSLESVDADPPSMDIDQSEGPDNLNVVDTPCAASRRNAIPLTPTLAPRQGNVATGSVGTPVRLLDSRYAFPHSTPRKKRGIEDVEDPDTPTHTTDKHRRFFVHPHLTLTNTGPNGEELNPNSGPFPFSRWVTRFMAAVKSLGGSDDAEPDNTGDAKPDEASSADPKEATDVEPELTHNAEPEIARNTDPEIPENAEQETINNAEQGDANLPADDPPSDERMEVIERDPSAPPPPYTPYGFTFPAAGPSATPREIFAIPEAAGRCTTGQESTQRGSAGPTPEDTMGTPVDEAGDDIPSGQTAAILPPAEAASPIGARLRECVTYDTIPGNGVPSGGPSSEPLSESTETSRADGYGDHPPSRVGRPTVECENLKGRIRELAVVVGMISVGYYDQETRTEREPLDMLRQERNTAYENLTLTKAEFTTAKQNYEDWLRLRGDRDVLINKIEAAKEIQSELTKQSEVEKRHAKLNRELHQAKCQKLNHHKAEYLQKRKSAFLKIKMEFEQMGAQRDMIKREMQHALQEQVNIEKEASELRALVQAAEVERESLKQKKTEVQEELKAYTAIYTRTQKERDDLIEQRDECRKALEVMMAEHAVTAEKRDKWKHRATMFRTKANDCWAEIESLNATLLISSQGEAGRVLAQPSDPVAGPSNAKAKDAEPATARAMDSASGKAMGHSQSAKRKSGERKRERAAEKRKLEKAIEKLRAEVETMAKDMGEEKPSTRGRE
ncbi:hypothetical protein FRB99_003193 [Tulasnella sp. 403]|nr:hypothetical protein FRB99_003193 [Tulasnella sp. 403]